MKYINKIRKNLSSKSFPTFSIYDVKSMLVAQGANPDYAYILLNNLTRRNEVKRITRGMYTFHEDIRVVGFAFTPFYYGLEDALTIRNLWEQGSNPVVITPRKVRNGVRGFHGRNYVLHRIEKTHFFGYDLIRRGNFWIPVSDTEKTLIDFIYFRHYLSEDVLKRIAAIADMKKLKQYLHSYDPRIADKVMRIAKERIPNSKAQACSTSLGRVSRRVYDQG